MISLAKARHISNTSPKSLLTKCHCRSDLPSVDGARRQFIVVGRAGNVVLALSRHRHHPWMELVAGRRPFILATNILGSDFSPCLINSSLRRDGAWSPLISGWAWARAARPPAVTASIAFSPSASLPPSVFASFLQHFLSCTKIARPFRPSPSPCALPP